MATTRSPEAAERRRQSTLMAEVLDLAGNGHTSSALLLFHVPDVAKLLAAPEAVARCVLGDPQLRSKLVSGAGTARLATWRRALRDRIKLSEEQWILTWLAPALSPAELHCLAVMSLQRGKGRFGIRTATFPVMAGAAVVYLDEDPSFESVDDGAYVIASRRFAKSVLETVRPIAVREGLVARKRPAALASSVRDPRPKHEMLARQGVGWWHGGN